VDPADAAIHDRLLLRSRHQRVRLMGISVRSRSGHRRRGQALVEFVLIFPLFLLVLMSILVFGLYVFYTQQLASAAREGARYAAVHGSGAQCPTVSRLDPAPANRFTSYWRCDAPEGGWPNMTGAARSMIWGVPPTAVSVRACWSGYTDGAYNYDLKASQTGASFAECTIGGVNPQTSPDALSCPPPAAIGSTYTPAMADGDDKASNLAHSPPVVPGAGATPDQGAQFPTTVTLYTCFQWRPPLAGFVLIPSQITLRAVVTEAIQRQQ
jgi:hypothetical protein